MAYNSRTRPRGLLHADDLAVCCTLIGLGQLDLEAHVQPPEGVDGRV